MNGRPVPTFAEPLREVGALLEPSPVQALEGRTMECHPADCRPHPSASIIVESAVLSIPHHVDLCWYVSCTHSESAARPGRDPETTLSCLHTILEEEWEHHRYAVRDLDAIEVKPA